MPGRAREAAAELPHAPSLAERLADLSRRVGRLSPSHRDPERFFVERSEIEGELRQIASRSLRL